MTGNFVVLLQAPFDISKGYHNASKHKKKLGFLTGVPNLKKGDDISEFETESYANTTPKKEI